MKLTTWPVDAGVVRQLHRDEHGVGAGHASGCDFRGQPARDRAQIDGAGLDQVIQRRSHGRLLTLRSRRRNADHQGTKPWPA